MSIINTALIGKIKKTKADKSNVLQLDNDLPFTPSFSYQPSTKKYVDDTVTSNKLNSIVDLEVVSLIDQKTGTTANDLSSFIGPTTTLQLKNYSKSLFLQNQSLVIPSSDINTPVTIEGWFYYLDDSASTTSVLEVGGDLGNGKSQWCRVYANGSIYALDVTGTYGMQVGGAFTPYGGWVHYALYVGQTDFCLWINGNRQTYGDFLNNVSGDYRQTVPRTYSAFGTGATTNPIIAPFGIYDSIRISSGDIYGKSNASFTPPPLLNVNGSTKHLYHVDVLTHASVVNEIFVHAPTQNLHAASKLYVDTAIANIPVTVDTNTYLVGGSLVGGNTLSLTQNNGTSVNVDLSLLLDDTNTYVINGDVQYGTLTLNQNNGTSINIDVSSLLDDTTNTISSGVLSGNDITFTRQDGTTFTVNVAALYDDTNIVTSVNGSTGAITVPLLSSTSFNPSTNVLTTNRSDGVSYTADFSSLAFDQSLNTTNDVTFNQVTSTYLDSQHLNILTAIHFNTITGSQNQVITTAADGKSVWSDVKTINGQTLIGTGNLSLPIFNGTLEVAGNAPFTSPNDFIGGASYWNSMMGNEFRIIVAAAFGTTTPFMDLLDTLVGGDTIDITDPNGNSTTITLPSGGWAVARAYSSSGGGNYEWRCTTDAVNPDNWSKFATLASISIGGSKIWTFTDTGNIQLPSGGDIVDSNGVSVIDMSGKQDTLVSGTNIKTINGQSLLGSGDITITANGVDKYVTSGAVIGTTLRLTNNDATTIDINVGALLDDTTNTVSTGTLIGNVIRFTRQDGTTFDVNVAALYDDTNLVTSVNGQTGAVTITDTNNYLSSATLNGTTLTLARSGLSNLTVDLSSLQTIDTDNYVDSASLNGNVLTLGRSGSLPDLTVDLSTLHSIDTDNYVDSVALNGNILTLGRSGSLPDLTVDLSSLGGTSGSTNSLIRRESQEFTAINGQTNFTTTFTLHDVEVFYNGFKLSDTDFTTSGNTLTLLEAAFAGDNIEVIDYGNAVGVDVAYQKYTFDVTTQTSVFNVAYAIGQVEVFLNGMKLTDTEYTADNGTTVTLVPPVQSGDYVEIITMIATTSGNYYTKAEVDQMIAGAGTGTATTSGVTSQVIDTFSTNDYRSGEYLLTVTGSGFMTLKMMVLFNGTTALNTQYAQLGDDLGTFDTLLNGTNVQVVFTPIDQSSTVQFSRTLIENLGGTPSQTLPNDLNTGSGTIDLNSGSGTIDLNGTIIPNDLNAGSGTIDLLSGSGINDLNQ